MRRERESAQTNFQFASCGPAMRAPIGSCAAPPAYHRSPHLASAALLCLWGDRTSQTARECSTALTTSSQALGAGGKSRIELVCRLAELTIYPTRHRLAIDPGLKRSWYALHDNQLGVLSSVGVLETVPLATEGYRAERFVFWGRALTERLSAALAETGINPVEVTIVLERQHVVDGRTNFQVRKGTHKFVAWEVTMVAALSAAGFKVLLVDPKRIDAEFGLMVGAPTAHQNMTSKQKTAVSKRRYKYRKARAVERARHMIGNANFGGMVVAGTVAAIFEMPGKKDELADAMLLLVAYHRWAARVEELAY
ncbi:hypothetical protein DFJ74DRAFT_684591 [Hyaloraphidium curvatum]|nr:hypothetical protein DFJ74DRAFT_684591 [Hyaloraphidium curvatum]